MKPAHPARLHITADRLHALADALILRTTKRIAAETLQFEKRMREQYGKSALRQVKAATLFAEGLTVAEIAAEVGTTTVTVNKALAAVVEALRVPA